jgi:hypothetical protein
MVVIAAMIIVSTGLIIFPLYFLFKKTIYRSQKKHPYLLRETEIEDIYLNDLKFKKTTNFRTKSNSIMIEPDEFGLVINANQIKTRDFDFDKQVIVISDNEIDTIARLTEKIRKKLARFSKKVVFNNKGIRIDLKDQTDFMQFDQIGQLSEIYKKIFRSDDINTLLVNNIKNDTNNKVRENNLEILIKRESIVKYEKFINSLKNDPNVNIALLACSYFKDVTMMINILNKNKKTYKIPIRVMGYIYRYLEDKTFLKTMISSLSIMDKSNIGLFLDEMFKQDLTNLISNIIDSLNHMPENIIEVSDIIRLIRFFTKNEIEESLEWIERMKVKYPDSIGDIAQNAIHIILKDQKGDLAIVDKINSGELSISGGDGKLSEIDE